MTITKSLIITLIIFLPLKYIASNYATKLPEMDKLHPDLFSEPVQGHTGEKPYKFKYKDIEYFVRPLASYEIHALVVSHNNISSIADIYHTSDSVDFKDLCVVSGLSLENGSYLYGKYSSSSWTCHFQWDRKTDFQPSDLSNIHLLSQNPKVKSIIEKAKVGDQIYLVGNLVEYGNMKDLSFMRKSSLTRHDTGCEVMMVDYAKILERNNPFWSSIYNLSTGTVYLLIPAIIISWLFNIWLNYKKRYGSLD